MIGSHLIIDRGKFTFTITLTINGIIKRMPMNLMINCTTIKTIIVAILMRLPQEIIPTRVAITQTVQIHRMIPVIVKQVRLKILLTKTSTMDPIGRTV